jgi:small subunit ribosomal protein S11
MEQALQKYFPSSQIDGRDQNQEQLLRSISARGRGGGHSGEKGYPRKKPRTRKPRKTSLERFLERRARPEKPFSVAHIKTTFTNTIVTVTDRLGNALLWESAGKMKLKGGKKKTPYAARRVALKACRRAYLRGIRDVEVVIRGASYTRKSALRGASKAGVGFLGVKVFNLLPHNGCRQPKKRRRKGRKYP